MKQEWSIDKKELDRLKENLQRQIQINNKVDDLLNKVESMSFFFENEIYLSMLSRKDVIDYFSCLCVLYRLSGDLYRYEQYKKIYYDYYQGNLYTELAEEALTFIETDTNIAIKIHQNLYKAYLEDGDVDKAKEHENKIFELKEELDC